MAPSYLSKEDGDFAFIPPHTAQHERDDEDEFIFIPSKRPTPPQPSKPTMPPPLQMPPSLRPLQSQPQQRPSTSVDPSTLPSPSSPAPASPDQVYTHWGCGSDSGSGPSSSSPAPPCSDANEDISALLSTLHPSALYSHDLESALEKTVQELETVRRRNTNFDAQVRLWHTHVRTLLGVNAGLTEQLQRRDARETELEELKNEVHHLRELVELLERALTRRGVRVL